MGNKSRETSSTADFAKKLAPSLYVFPLFLMLYEFTVYMSNDMYIPAFPLIARDFSVNEEMVQLTLSSWLLGGATAQLILGPLSDKFGRRPILFGGGLLFILSCFGCFLTSSMLVFIGFRFLQGVGVCSMMIAGYACIHESYRDHEAINILSIMSAVSITAPMIGPLAGGLLILHHDWRMVFFIIGIMAVISIIFLYFFMPKDKLEGHKRFSLENIFSSYLQLLSNRKFISYALIFGLLYSGIMLWIAASPFILMVEKSFDARQFGILQIPVFGSFALGTQLTRSLTKRFSLNEVIAIGIVGTFLGAAICLFGVFFFEHSILGIILGMSLYSASFGSITAPLNRLSFNAANTDKGITASIFYTCMMATGSIITTVFGFLYTGHVISYVLMLIGVIIATGLLYKKSFFA